MIFALLSQRAADPSPWLWAVGGLVTMAVGLLLILRPRKSGEIIDTINQSLRPRYRPTPVPVIVVVGCFALLLGAGFLYGAWVVWSR